MKKLNIINQIKFFIGVKLFKKRKPFKFIIFDILFSFLILNKKQLPKFAAEYDSKGFVKIYPNIENEIKKLKTRLVLENPNLDKPYFNFKINDDIKNTIQQILKILDKDYLLQLKKYYKAEILPTYVMLRRNNYYKQLSLRDEAYSNNFHNDSYLRTHFKIFVNLQDISKEHGPMKIVPKNKSKDFIVETNYISRMSYNEQNDKFSYLNTGKFGECLLFDPTSCLHRAGVPEENYKRDFMTIYFVCVPNKDELINNLKQTNIFEYENNNLLSFAKPRKLFDVFNLLLNFYRH